MGKFSKVDMRASELGHGWPVFVITLSRLSYDLRRFCEFSYCIGM